MAKSGAAFSLPLPLDAFETINECIARVYGTGEPLMSMSGDHVTIIEPEGGWGPRKRGRGALPSVQHDEMRFRWLAVRDKTVELTVEDMQYTVLYVSEVARRWFEHVGGVNYVEVKLVHADAPDPEYVFTMQRIDGLTPADKVAQAEARIAELEAENERLRGGLVQG